jgi:hypothetical protein
MKNIYAVVAAVVLCGALSAPHAQAQIVHQGSQFPGISVGVNFNEGEDIPIGVNYEYFLKRDFAIGALFRYWTYNAYTFADGGKYVFTSYLVGAEGNYHFKVPQRELDPYMGVVLGYRIVNSGVQNTVQSYAPPVPVPASVIFAIQAAARYFITEQIGLGGRLLFGSGGFTVFELSGDFAL